MQLERIHIGTQNFVKNQSKVEPAARDACFPAGLLAF